jgi:hypothetical protein
MAREYGVIESAGCEREVCAHVAKDLGAAVKWRDRQYDEFEMEDLDVLIMSRVASGEWSSEF